MDGNKHAMTIHFGAEVIATRFRLRVLGKKSNRDESNGSLLPYRYAAAMLQCAIELDYGTLKIVFQHLLSFITPEECVVTMNARASYSKMILVPREGIRVTGLISAPPQRACNALGIGVIMCNAQSSLPRRCADYKNAREKARRMGRSGTY